MELLDDSGTPMLTQPTFQIAPEISTSKGKEKSIKITVKTTDYAGGHIK